MRFQSVHVKPDNLFVLIGFCLLMLQTDLHVYEWLKWSHKYSNMPPQETYNGLTFLGKVVTDKFLHLQIHCLFAK